MAQRGRNISPQRTSRTRRMSALIDDDEDSIINSRHLEAFGRTVHATATQLISANFSGTDGTHGTDSYRSAMSSVHRSMRRPIVQRSVFSLAKASPRELIRSNFNTAEIEHRALTWLPDELLRNVPQTSSPFSLLEGFKASLPANDTESSSMKTHPAQLGYSGKEQSQELDEKSGLSALDKARREKERADHRLEMMGIRKTMCAGEIKEIDSKIVNLSEMRGIVLNRLAALELEESELESEIHAWAEKVDELEESGYEQQRTATSATHSITSSPQYPGTLSENGREQTVTPGFMSESIYSKLPPNNVKDSPNPKRKRVARRTISTPVLHEHMESGAQIRKFQAHNDTITALDFDVPWGTMVSAALDDTVRVWDLNAGRCMGFLEGHLSSVRCLQVEDNIVATGAMDASIRLWDLNQAKYSSPRPLQDLSKHTKTAVEDNLEKDTDAVSDGDDLFTVTPTTANHTFAPTKAHDDAMADCHVFTLSAHVAEVTALHLHGSTLISGSADKTLRQWDLEKGRCVQTLDVLWAAAQASTVNPSISTVSPNSEEHAAGVWWRPTSGRVSATEADFVGAVQVFETALACGTADGMVRLWDLRSGMVHRSLVGHTGPVTALQFDDVYLVTGSHDRSIRIWDLRTGTIHDAFAYDNPITSMNFDARRIVTAAGDPFVKVYDKTDGRQWDCGQTTIADSDTQNNTVEKLRIRDGYLVEGRRDGLIGVWSC